MNNQYFHHHNNQELEWISRISSSSTSNTNPSTAATRIEVLDDDGGDNGGVDGNKTAVIIEREHMFDKVVTPSDVGKLNRLVIPKQHAEKYFPLDSSNNEKGLLLNFEDRTGKPWRFRYSYWNSSQSYVMTKGWSRFVKEKKLDAGDIVSFQRGVGDVGKDKLFIDWRRRPDSSGLLPYPPFHHHHHLHGQAQAQAQAQARNIPGLAWGSSTSPPFVLRSHPHPHQPYLYPLGPPLQSGPSGIWDQHIHPSHGMNLMNVLPSSQSNPGRRGTSLGLGSGLNSGGGGYGFGFGNVVNPYPITGSLIFLRPSTTTVQNVIGSENGVSSLEDHDNNNHHLNQNQTMMMMEVQGDEARDGSMVYESVPVVQGKATAKRLRLFGVNMECPISHQTHDFDILSSSLASSSSLTHHHHRQQQHVAGLSSSSSSSHHQQLQPLLSSSSSSFFHDSSKGKSPTSSPMSLDLDI